MKSSKKKLSLKQRAKQAGISVQLVYNRKSAGWSEKKALSVPVGKYTPKKVKPKKVAYKVEPKKEQASGSRVKHIPMEGIQKFESPKRSNWQVYVVVVLIVGLVLAIILR